MNSNFCICLLNIDRKCDYEIFEIIFVLHTTGRCTCDVLYCVCLACNMVNEIEISKLVVVNVSIYYLQQCIRYGRLVQCFHRGGNALFVAFIYTNYAFVWWRLWVHINFKVKFVGLLFTLTWLQSSRLVLLLYIWKLINVALCECYAASSSSYSSCHCSVELWDSVSAVLWLKQRNPIFCCI